MEILARYEAVFRTANLYPGEITTSGLAALNLYHDSGVAVIAKMTGNVLTVMAVADGQLKLFRCLTIEEGVATRKSWRCSIRPSLTSKTNWAGSPKSCCCADSRKPPEGLKLEMEPLRSRLGTPNAYNAGLLGYLEAAG